jgi:cytochrome c oxidase cbb3-type subunit 3
VVYQVRGYEKRGMTWQIITKIVATKVGLALMLFGAISAGFGQNSNSADSAPISQQELKGKSVFEMKCSTCHGLDGHGGEHAPDIIRRTAVRTLSDQALLNLIHEGITEAGMPSFSNLGEENDQALIAYMRFLQGKSAAGPTRGDPARGQDLFFGKAGCSACHSRGKFIAEDLTGFSRDHSAAEIREAIVSPNGGSPEGATAVARDGRKFSGMVRNEDNASLQLQDGDGRFYLLMKSSLVSVQRKAGEPMPVNYGQRLSTTEIDDLVSFILREARASNIPSSPSGKDEALHVQD